MSCAFTGHIGLFCNTAPFGLKQKHHACSGGENGPRVIIMRFLEHSTAYHHKEGVHHAYLFSIRRPRLGRPFEQHKEQPKNPLVRRPQQPSFATAYSSYFDEQRYEVIIQTL